MARELAILVTARNMASGVLKDVRGDIKGIQSEARRGLQNTARNLGMAAAAGGVLVATQVKQGLDSLIELERLTAQTNAVLESTGSAAAGSVADIRARSEALERLTTVDDKVIQNAQNLLLTFPEVGEKAFEPTLQAALDLNAALGGDDESLQQVLIQVAKAVNDPITGLTALRRSGVSFTQQQRDQIKAMTEAGDTAGAQAIVLEELNNQFGGSAVAQADTYAGKMRRVADAVEDAQMALATAFLPVLERVGDELQTFLSDPDTLENIEEFGGVLADGLNDAIDIAKKLPWDAIGTTFSLMGQGARTVLDMFTQMPPWVQTAILTGWGLNKLTGGALGNIFSTLASGLIKGVLNMNAGVVNINAASVRGGPGVGPAGGGKGGGKLPPVVGGALGAAGVALMLSGSDNPEADPVASQQVQLTSLHDSGLLTDATFQDLWKRAFEGEDIGAELAAIREGVKQSYDATGRAEAAIRDAVPWAQRNLAELQNLNASEGRRFGSTLGTLQTIANKRTVFDPKITVNANINNVVTLSTGAVMRQINNYRQTLNAGTSVSGFI